MVYHVGKCAIKYMTHAAIARSHTTSIPRRRQWSVECRRSSVSVWLRRGTRHRRCSAGSKHRRWYNDSCRRYRTRRHTADIQPAAQHTATTVKVLYLRATERHLPHGITQCYLPPDTGERARFNLTPARQVGTRFTNPGGTEGLQSHGCFRLYQLSFTTVCWLSCMRKWGKAFKLMMELSIFIDFHETVQVIIRTGFNLRSYTA